MHTHECTCMNLHVENQKPKPSNHNLLTPFQCYFLFTVQCSLFVHWLPALVSPCYIQLTLFQSDFSNTLSISPPDFRILIDYLLSTLGYANSLPACPVPSMISLSFSHITSHMISCSIHITMCSSSIMPASSSLQTCCSLYLELFCKTLIPSY